MMDCINYKFTPADIALYFLMDDLPHSKQKDIIRDLFDNCNDLIEKPFCEDLPKFKSQISDLMISWESDDETLDEVELIKNELGIAENDESDLLSDYFGAYFKLIKLQLLYSGANYRKIKLRTLIKDFGYQRRTVALMDNINSMLIALGLTPYLKNHTPCELSSVKLDDMIILRLKN